MADRKAFLTHLGIVGAIIMAGTKAGAQDASPAPTLPATVTATESPTAASPAASPQVAKRKAPAPSAAAVAIAATMLRFDAKLTAADLASIAKQIDDNAGAGKALNAKKRRLSNAVAPITVFRVEA